MAVRKAAANWNEVKDTGDKSFEEPNAKSQQSVLLAGKGVRLTEPDEAPTLNPRGDIITDQIVGTHIGIFDVISKSETKSNDGHTLYNVKCSICGWEGKMRKCHIGSAKTCKHRSITGAYITNDNRWSNRRLRKIFRAMFVRCYDPADKDYRWYGARGIHICNEWLNNPLEFEHWALSNGYEDNLTIDRIDAHRDYCPENCRWVTKAQNSKYKTTTRCLVVDGVSHTGREWADILGVSTNVINTLLRTKEESTVSELIRRRLANPTLNCNGKSWLSTYGIQN